MVGGVTALVQGVEDHQHQGQGDSKFNKYGPHGERRDELAARYTGRPRPSCQFSRPFSALAMFRSAYLMRHVAVVAILLAGCASQAPVSTPPAGAEVVAKACPGAPTCPASAVPVTPVIVPTLPVPAETLPVTPPRPAKPLSSLQMARWDDLPGWREDDLLAAWPAFLESCRVLQKQSAWSQVCEEAVELAKMPPDKAALKDYFESRFMPWQVVNADDSREGLITGYYEPLLKGATKPGKLARYPVLAVPDDLLSIDLGDLYPDLKSLRLRGRLEGKKVVPYYSRAELRQRDGQAKVLYWVNDPIELFFLQVQGSGRIELEDGSRVRVGYADQNGHPYLSIGRWLIDRGELRPDQASMDGIKSWAREHPERLDELLDVNPSVVFFRKLPDDGKNAGKNGPPGALGVPLTPGRSVAVDPRSLPLGAPVYLAATWPNTNRPLQRLVLAQDTGGAIKGGVRADFFWGFGSEAASQAGRMKQKGRLWVLLPLGLNPAQVLAPK